MRRLLAIIAFLVTGCTLWANSATVAKGNRYSDICVSEIVLLGE